MKFHSGDGGTTVRGYIIMYGLSNEVQQESATVIPSGFLAYGPYPLSVIRGITKVFLSGKSVNGNSSPIMGYQTSLPQKQEYFFLILQNGGYYNLIPRQRGVSEFDTPYTMKRLRSKRTVRLPVGTRYHNLISHLIGVSHFDTP